jgi:nucleoside phosphorylase
MPPKRPDGPVILRPVRATRRPIFLHFLDAPYYRKRSAGQFKRRAASEAELAVRLAVIMSSDIMVPAAAYYENPTAKIILDAYEDTDLSELFELVGTGDSIEEFADAKLPQYSAQTIEGRIYRRRLFQPFPWLRRDRSATKDIATAWMEALHQGTVEETLLVDRRPARVAEITRAWSEVPEKLAGKAFTAANVSEFLPSIRQNMEELRKLGELINNEYLLSYLIDVRAGVFQRMPWLSSGVPTVSVSSENDIDFRTLTTVLRDTNVIKDIVNSPINSLRNFIHDERFVEAFHNSQGVQTKMTSAKHTGAVQIMNKIDALIVTALPEEKDALLAVYGRYERRTYPNDSHIYYLVTDRVGNRRLRIAIAHPDQMGEAPASATATDMLRTFETNFVVMTGVAGGCPNPERPAEHVRLGDVVVASQIFKHDNVKVLGSGKREYRDRPQIVGAKWIQVLSSCRRGMNKWNPTWIAQLSAALHNVGIARPDATSDILRDHGGFPIHHPKDEERTENEPRIFNRLIASGGSLLKDPILRDELHDIWGAAAVEMESSGVRDAVRTKKKELISVRGIMDYCDGAKNDSWKNYAAIAAAAFTRMLVSQIPEDWL